MRRSDSPFGANTVLQNKMQKGSFCQGKVAAGPLLTCVSADHYKHRRQPDSRVWSQTGGSRPLKHASTLALAARQTLLSPPDEPLQRFIDNCFVFTNCTHARQQTPQRSSRDAAPAPPRAPPLVPAQPVRLSVLYPRVLFLLKTPL